MVLDLSALEEKPVAASLPTGKPLDIPLALIEEDPDQPRKEFTPESMQEMIDSIRVRGVKTPVSIRPHPSKPNMWMLNYGARRYRGSVAAGRETIPAFLDESHNDYDQVIENIQRDDLKPMELALFIKKRLDAGDQKKEIAKNLGKDGGIVTHHLALINPPACIEDAYRKGKCTSPKTLYELRGLHEKFPDQVDAWCNQADEITRKSVAELAETLKGKNKPSPLPPVEDSKFGHDQIYVDSMGGTGVENSKAKPTRKNDHGTSAISESDISPAVADLKSWSNECVVSDPDLMNKPLLLVEFDGRSAVVLLNRRPTARGLIHIRFEDNGVDQEVDGRACKIDMLTEIEK